MGIFDSTLKGLGHAFNGAVGQGSDELQQEKSINALRKAMAAMQGREVFDMPSAAALRKNSAPISAGILQERAEQERLAAERTVVINCEGIDGIELFVKNGEKGALLRALDADKEVILKGFQKLKPGTDNHFEHFNHFLDGILSEYAVFAPDSFGVDPPIAQYTQANIKPQFRITIEVVSLEDGSTCQSQKKSVSRKSGKRVQLVPQP